MLRSLKEIRGYTLSASDGELGRCKDFLFDERPWMVRYMVVDTGSWLAERKVLITPSVLGEPDWSAERFPVELSKQQIADAPGLDSDAPVSRHYELSYNSFFGLPNYWSDPLIPPPFTEKAPPPPTGQDTELANCHLRSANEVTGYKIAATDGEIGHVEDFVFEDQDWDIRYLIVATRNWWPGKKVLVAPAWLGKIDWAHASVEVHMTREQLKQSPPFDETLPIDRNYEKQLHAFYKFPGYWE